MQKLLLILSIFVLSCSKTDNKIMELRIKNSDIDLHLYTVEKTDIIQFDKTFKLLIKDNDLIIGQIEAISDNDIYMTFNNMNDIVYGKITIDESNNISVSATSQKGSHLHLHNY